MDEKQINRFQDIMKYTEENVLHRRSQGCYVHGILGLEWPYPTGLYEKTYKEITEFSKYLESIGLGVVSPETEK